MKRISLLVILLIASAVFAGIRWDFNGDLKVNLQDVGLVSAKIGLATGGSGWDSRYDLDSNGVIDSLDVAIVVKYLNITDNMALVPAGEFIMGGKISVMPDTIHVYLDSFFIDKYETTVQEYVEFLNNGNAADYYYDEQRKPIFQKGDSFFVSPGSAKLPINNLTWDAANRYCKSRGKRLPTFAELEKAARGTDGRKYTWGNAIADSGMTNFNYRCDTTYMNRYPNQNMDSICVWSWLYTHPESVGSYGQDVSPYGVYDLCGNVSEWSNDWKDPSKVPNYYWLLIDARHNPKGAPTGTVKLSKGGTYADYQTKVTTFWSYLTGDPLIYRSQGLGVRCAY
ncbi:MAG: SUMF1/EgtB/PvdO family nonheme iron enzyme [Fibrobacteres bacterium]|nr:SUMF1/EgtB/PvdO family nonheme iron enzyme [Fibrobacterota bacterium]